MKAASSASAPALHTTSHYGPWHALLDIAGLSAFVSAMLLLLISLTLSAGAVLGRLPHAEWIFAGLVFAALVAADFVSGLVHFLADNFGDPDTPILGRVFIFPFREHHVDPKAITRHGYLETNGANCLISLPVVICVLCFTSGEEDFLLRLFAFFFLTAIFFTNQIHKWAHTDTPPAIIRFLQKYGLILSPENHAVHHRAPHDQYYCITLGWLNLPLMRLQFFTRLKGFLKKPIP